MPPGFWGSGVVFSNLLVAFLPPFVRKGVYTIVSSGPGDLLAPTGDLVPVLLLSALLVIRHNYVVVGRCERLF